MYRSLITVLVFMALTPSSQAGEPLETVVECPLGGEEFSITETASCSSLGGTMALRGVTSCDFVTRLPVCPSNRLPMYREFDDAELSRLEDFVKSDAYRGFLSRSPWLRAYAVEVFLKGDESEMLFRLMQNGMWFDGEKLRADPYAIGLLLTEAEHEKSIASAEDRPFILAATAYQLLASGREELARTWISEARSASGDSDFLKSYLAAVESCIGRMSDPDCQPEAEFNP
jgi:hypothetical protein